MAEKSNLFILTSFIPLNLADMEKVKLLPPQQSCGGRSLSSYISFNPSTFLPTADAENGLLNIS